MKKTEPEVEMIEKKNIAIIQEIEKKIKDIEKEEKNDINDILIKTLLAQKDKLKEEEKEIKKAENIKELTEKKRELTEKLKEQIDKGNIKDYEKIKSEIWKINKILREKKRDIKYLNLEQLEKIFKVLRKDKREISKLYRTMILTAYEGACRPSELLEIRLTDINLKENTLFIRRLKGSNDTKIYLSKKLSIQLKEILKKTTKDNIYLFENNGKKYEVTNFRRIFQRICEKADIQEDLRKIHSLRHSRAVLSVIAGANLVEVQYLLGHRNINNTMIYLNYIPTEFNIENLYKKINFED